MNESWHTCAGVKEHTSMCHVKHMKKSCCIYEKVTAHIWTMSHVCMNASRPTCEWVTSHIQMNHVTHMNKSCQAYLKKDFFFDMLNIWYAKYVVYYGRERLCDFEIMTSHIWMSHITHTHGGYMWMRHMWMRHIWLSHMSINHMTHISYIWMSHITHTHGEYRISSVRISYVNESYHTVNESYQTYSRRIHESRRNSFYIRYPPWGHSYILLEYVRYTEIEIIAIVSLNTISHIFTNTYLRMFVSMCNIHIHM